MSSATDLLSDPATFMASAALLRKLTLEDKTIPADFRGHLRHRGQDNLKYQQQRAQQALLFLSNAQDIIDHAAPDKWVTLKAPLGNEPCPTCQQKLTFECNGTTLRATTECPYANGIPPLELSLNIPSGKMVVANDLRDLFPVAADYDINSTLGSNLLSKEYEAAGMIHVFTGNTCPSLYQTSDAKKGKPGRTFELGTSCRRSRKQLCSVCTDLWWVSICDYDAFVAAGGKIRKGTHSVVRCVPGTYAFVHDFSHDFTTFTRISLKGAPTEPIDYKAAYKQLDYTLEEVLAAFDAHWDGYLASFDDSDPAARAQRMLSHLFFTLGSGVEWHPNGWAQVTKMPDRTRGTVLPSMEVPALTKPYSWYPVSTYSQLASMAGISDPSFPYSRKRGILNASHWRGLVTCLQNIIVHGTPIDEMNPRITPDGSIDGQPGSTLTCHAPTEYLAPACLDGLMAHYPKFVTPEDKLFATTHHVVGSKVRYTMAIELSNAIADTIKHAASRALAPKPLPKDFQAHVFTHTGTPKGDSTQRTLAFYPLGYQAYHQPPKYSYVLPENAAEPFGATLTIHADLRVTYMGQTYCWVDALAAIPQLAAKTALSLPLLQNPSAP